MEKKYVKLGDMGGSKEMEVEELSGKVREVARSSSAPGARGGLSRSVSPAKRLKRACVMDECVRESGNDELSSMSTIGGKLRKFLCAEGNRVPKSVSEFVLGCVSEYEMQLMKMVSKNERLCGRLEECEKNAVRSENVCAQKSFASVAAKGVSVTKNVPASVSVSVREKSYALVVKPKDEAQKMTSEEVKKKVMSSVRDSVNMRVKAVRKTRGGGLAIETATEQDLNVLRECKKFAEVGLKVELPKKIGPKVVLFDVPNEVTNEELLKDLYVKNLESEGIGMNVMKERVRVINRMNRKGADVGNVVIEVTRKIFDVLLSVGRVYVKWRCCRVKEWLNVMRCFKCLAFGHMMRECSVKERLYQKCGESGHLRESCQKVSACRNCRLRGKDANHSVLSVECPEYVKMYEREKARISND